jgi:imidazole glycerol-phosphate synthase subunit HisH
VSTSAAPRIAVVDYGMGNRRSVEKAVERVGGRPEITRDHDAIRAADGVIVPGVGAFRAAMDALRDLGLDAVLLERAAAGVPLLGICLGMQVLFDSSPEFGEAEGLGLLRGTVEPLRAEGLRLPHIGWSTVTWRRGSPLTRHLPPEGAFYHVHSFAARPAEEADVLGTAEYGEPFVTAVARDNVFGVQFHAEKSSTLGMALLQGFVEETGRVVVPAG